MARSSFWSSLNPRERRLIGFGGTALVVALVWVLILDPWYQQLRYLRSQVPQKESTLAWMKNEIESVRALMDGGDEAEQPRQPLLTVIERSAQRDRLRERISRIQPVDESQVRVWLDGAAFDDWLTWIDGLRKQGITVDAVEVTRATENTVNIRVTLLRA
jgi:general secretion pathway protein M